MGPVNTPARTQTSALLITSRTIIKLLVVCLVIATVPLVLYVRVDSKSQKTAVDSKAAITVHAAAIGGKPYMNLQDGRRLSVSFQGDREAAAALQNGAAQARALASADFDRNGTPDVVAGYAANGAGMITLQRGNPDAFAPADDSVFVRIQQGYNPDSLLPGADVYAVPVSPDFLVTGNFTHDSEKDVLFAAKGGPLYLMEGDGAGRFGDPKQLGLPGLVTALAAGEFRAADGFTDVAVGVTGPGGDSLLIFDAVDGFANALGQYQLSAPASGIELGGLDDDPFMDVAVAAGSEILVVHGWGRKEQGAPTSREERINVGANLRGLALGEFAWDRDGRSEIAALSDDGAVHIVENAKLDSRPFSEAEAAERTRGKLKPTGLRSLDVESVPSWHPQRAAGWTESSSFTASSFAGVSSSSAKPLLRTNLSYRETDDLMVISESQTKVEIMHLATPGEKALGELSTGDLPRTTLDTESAPVAVLPLPRKLNGTTDVVMLSSASTEPTIVPNAPNTTITVDRTDDPSGGSLAAVSACTAAGSDCSLRGALQFANNIANNNTTISLPAGTYILSTNGSGAGGCDGNAVGDLGANQTMSIVGAGSATTIIRQTGTGPASDGDRVMCMNEPFTLNLIYNFSGFTMVGGRDGTAAGTGKALGGGGIIGGEKGNVLTMTNVVLANNQVTVLGSANIGGGGIQWTGGDMNVTNCTFGGTSLPGAYTDRTSTNTGNLQGGSGGGFMYTPSAPQHTAATGILTVTGSTISRNTAGSIGSGGGGADILNFAFAAPGGFATSGSATISTSTFSNNQAAVGHGGAIDIESLPTTVATTSFTNNSSNFTGGIYVGGGSLLLDGTTPSITFSGNTTTQGGSSVTTVAPVTVAGTNTTIGGSIEVAAGGSWTNNTGSTLSPTDVIVDGGTLIMNNSTMNVSGNLSVGPNSTLLFPGSFNGGTGTVNLAGTFTFNSAGSTTFTAGTGTFNFNGTGSQTITNNGSITFFNLTDSNTTLPLIANNSFNVNGSLNVNGASAIFNPVAAAVIGGTGTLTGTGTARVTRTAATADFSSQYSITNKTLTNLTVEYIGTAAQVLSAITYGPLKINNASGVNLAAGTSTVNGLLTLTTGALGVGNQTLVINDGSSVGTGSITSNPTGTVNYNQGSIGQNVRAFNYGNLTFSAFTKVLPATGTIGIAGTFNVNGIATGHTITGSTIDFNGTGAQSVPAFDFNNLTISGARTTNSVTLINGGTIRVAGTFSPTATFTTGNYIITNNTFEFNGAGAQTVGAPFNYNNLTVSGNRGGGVITLQAGTIGVAGVFSPTATNNTYVTTGNIMNFNGSAAQTIPAFSYGGLTLTNTAGGNLGGNVTVNGALFLASGALGVGTNTLILNGAASFGAGTLTSAATGTVNYNQQSNGQASVLAGTYGNLILSNFNKTLASGTINIAGTFTPGSATGHTITGNTINFNGAGSQSIPGFTYNNLTSTSAVAVARTLDPVNTIKIAGVFTPGASTYTITGSTVEYNGAAAQTLPATFITYNNLTLNNPTTTLGFAGLTVQGLLRVQAGTFTSSSTYNNVQIDLGATLAGTNATTINLSGNFANSGTFNGNGNTVNLNGTGAQTIGGTGTSNFSNLTNANTLAGGNGVTLGGNITVANALALGANNINTSTFTLTQPGTGTSSGTGDVIGNLKRTSLAVNTTYSFGNPLNTIKVEVLPVPTDITINLVKAAPADYPSAVLRKYTITPNGANGTVTLRLHYLDSELNGNNEAALIFRRFNGAGWSPVAPTSSDTAGLDNWLEKTGQPQLSPWTFSSSGIPTAASGTIAGRIADANGVGVEGAVVSLSGTQARKTITDAQGNYSFAEVETNGFYTVRAARANYSFSPQERSFSQIGNRTEATFTATALATSANPLDTAEYFVRQHYLDFLGREPDESGFNYWNDQVLDCGSDAACVELKRINVSAAYFLSIEFQATGGLVDGLYRASYGRAPQFAEFTPDTAQIAQNVIVGRGDWAQQLDANRVKFLDAYVGRPEFQNIYAPLNNDQYVDQLLTHTRIIWTDGERAGLVNGLTNGTLTRAEVLGQIAEDPRFMAAKRNEVFVMMEYFGYLRRDPDKDGFQFWLNKLNQHGGNFVQAEMVKAFITSIEYRQRFLR